MYVYCFCFCTCPCMQGNPCCEEPDYRLHVIHAIPSLRVLDQVCCYFHA